MPPSNKKTASAAQSQSASKPSAETEIKSPTHLQVRALQPGFRRAGRAWSTEETIVDIAEFSDEQVEQLMAEPMLSVVPICEAAAA